MTTQEILHLEDTYQIPTYKKMPIALERGSGIDVWDADGNHYLDFYGGHCVTLLGHSPEPVVKAVQDQAAKLMFYSNVVYSGIRAEAAQTLAQLAPEGLQHAFFCNSGTEANETALKLARTVTGKSHIVAMDGGFHGRTVGSLAATHEWKYRKPYADILPDVTFVPFGDSARLNEVLRSRDDVAAVILEPIQSMAGLYTAPDGYFRCLRAQCDAFGTLLIFDEVQTGVGRTGKFSISEHFGMKPDLITLAKSLGNGLPVGAVLASDAIAATVKYGDQGTTFGGGMLAMAAVKATLDTLVQENLMERATEIFARISESVGPHVKEVRGKGCLIGIDLGRPAKPVIDALFARGILTGGAGDPNVIRLMPPVNTPDHALEAFATAFAEAVSETLVPA